jgi:hypothetical protein
MRILAISMILLLALFTATVSAENNAVIPAWVKPGLVVTYDSVSAFVNQYGRFEQGVQIVMTSRVISVSGGKVSGVTQIQTVGAPIQGKHEWACNAAADCVKDATGLSGKFWVDPDHLTDSIKGPFGERYSVVGKMPYSRGGRSWDAVMLSYQNADTKVAYQDIVEAKTGLILAHAETSPSEQVHVYFRTMSGQ